MDNNKTFRISHKLELLIWLIVILFIVFIIVMSSAVKEKNNNSYSIFMPDVDGLIVGSPVRMMGVEVGHVTKIKPMRDEMYVKFILHDKDTNIPQGTIVTVEFSGMAGSKSLELYMPDKNTYVDDSVPILTVTKPKRLHDAAKLLNEMYRKLGSIISTTSSFSSEFQKEVSPLLNNGGKNDTKDFIQYADKSVDDAIIKEHDLNKKLNKFTGDKNANK